MKAKDLLNKIKENQLPCNDAVNEKLTDKQQHVFSQINDVSRIQDILDNYVQIMLLPPIYDVFTDEEKAVLNNVLVSNVRIEAINAKVCKTDENEYLIIITDRLMALLHTWNEIQIKLYLEKKTSLDEFSKAFAPIIDSYLTPNSNQALPVFSFDELPPEYSVMATTKTIMHERFILAHELAHIYLGHFENSPGFSAFSSGNVISNFYENPDAIQKEFDADVQAVKWLSRIAGADKALSMYVEALVVLHYIECNLGFPPSESEHPASLLRIININESCPDLFANCEYSLSEMIKNCLDIESFKIKQ